MKIVIAPDSFKGSLRAQEVAKALAAGIHEVAPHIHCIERPIADGGEGFEAAFLRYVGGHAVSVAVESASGRIVQASYGVLADGKTVVIEMAKASGLEQTPLDERNPLRTSTFGTGQLIHHALDAGYRSFIIGVGGSATNDGGAGALQALGLELLTSQGTPIERGGQQLIQIVSIHCETLHPALFQSTFRIVTDVTNPLTGPTGATAIFSEQKGATPTMKCQLEEGMVHFEKLIAQTTGHQLANTPGAGAAGGLAGGLMAFLPATLTSGIEELLQHLEATDWLADVDHLMTGEGKSDAQTLEGKAPMGLARLAKQYQLPIHLFSGQLEEEKELLQWFTSCHSILSLGVTEEQAMTNPTPYLKQLSRSWIEELVKTQQK